MPQQTRDDIKVIIFNGPPGSGKDTLGTMMHDFMHKQGHRKTYLQSFKSPLVDIALAVSGVERAQWNYWYSKDKEIARDELGGLSCREFLIKISEKTIKPVFGKGYFGARVSKTLLNGVNIFTDGGFVEEVEEIINVVGAQNVIIVRLHREGHTFKKDSRNYIYIPAVAQFDVNNVDVRDAFTEICLKLGLVKK